MAQCNHVGAWRLKHGNGCRFLRQLEHPACHLESLFPEVDDVTGEKLDKGDCNNCGCTIVLVWLQYNTVFPAAPPPPAPKCAPPPLEVLRICLFSSLFVSLVQVFEVSIDRCGVFRDSSWRRCLSLFCDAWRQGHINQVSQRAVTRDLLTRIDCQGRPSKARQWSNLGPIKNDELWWDCFVIDCKCLPSKPVALVILFFWEKSCKRGCWLLVFFVKAGQSLLPNLTGWANRYKYFSCGKYLFDKYALAFYHISGESRGDKDLLMSEQSKGNIFPQPIKKSTLEEGFPINLVAEAKKS